MARLPDRAEDFWSERSADYEAYVRRVVVRYDEIMARLLDYTPPFMRALELGCGSGNLALRLAERAPEAEMTFVDGSDEMVEMTRARLTRAHPATAARARFVVSLFEELDLEEGAYDLVISSLALHHVPRVGEIYAKAFRALAPGGAFRMSDGVRGETDATHAVHFDRWEDFWRRTGKLTDAEREDVLEHARLHDHYIPLREHFELLEAAGFRNSDCVWRDGLFAVITAERP